MIIVDRIEGSFAVADDNGRRINIKRCFLPPDTREGDVLIKKGQIYIKDQKSTTERRTRNRNLEKACGNDILFLRSPGKLVGIATAKPGLLRRADSLINLICLAEQNH